MQNYSFTHTFRAKTKQGQLQKGGASTANLEKYITMVGPFAWSSSMDMVLIATSLWQPFCNGLVEGAKEGFYFIL
jgi:hypothetical protein